MGLDTSYDCWHGPYSSFNRFREFLANEIGIDLNDYEGFGGKEKWSSVKHGIMPLLNHSDCDGRLTVKKCKKIVKGLNNVLENFDDKVEVDLYLKEKIIQFRDGCLLAIKNNEAVEFH